MVLNESQIVGVDEVGRGALFGPVFAGAVGLNNELARQTLLNAGLKDSKALTAKKRAMLVPLIKQNAKHWALGQSSAKEIDSIGIRKATELAMLRALQKLNHPISLLLVDGVLPLRLWYGPQKTLVHGDSKSAEIAAASVLAKEGRDEVIKRLATRYPAYGLKTNVGYGTQLHRKVLLTLGPTSLHRKSFLTKLSL
ncbi:ribonuclease HII [Prochlorococcus sp. MIT 1307]|uniref:ribonuclease HII n=1 Tax=Prochlorococcus sp. MIT 1307 TaxID=3096219 RepID=UPI0039BF3555